MPASALMLGDRRLEAATYLSEGFGIRQAIESKRGGWRPLGALARVSMPGRLKGIQVGREVGTPFLAATQVFDVRPIPRKWLALVRTDDASGRFAASGAILVTRSGAVGRATVAYAAHENTLISDDLLRVDANDAKLKGWLYAFLLAQPTRAMAVGAQYGHIIKHLETEHLDALPVPYVSEGVAVDFSRRLQQVVECRNRGYRLTLDAEARLEKCLGPLTISNRGEAGFQTKASRAFFAGRRRLDASVHSPVVSAIRRHMAKHGRELTTVSAAGFDVWVPGRYKRIPAPDGVIYRDSADLLEVSPDLSKRFADCRFGDDFRGRVKSGWILIPCSGQVYGIIGTATLATKALNDQVVSNHVIRVAPRKDSGMRVGYLVTVLSHVAWGRPLVKSLAFGSSVPEIAPEDLAALEIVRLDPEDESAIADLAEKAADLRAEADELEKRMADDAADIIANFISGGHQYSVDPVPLRRVAEATEK